MTVIRGVETKLHEERSKQLDMFGFGERRLRENM